MDKPAANADVEVPPLRLQNSDANVDFKKKLQQSLTAKYGDRLAALDKNNDGVVDRQEMLEFVSEVVAQETRLRYWRYALFGTLALLVLFALTTFGSVWAVVALTQKVDAGGSAAGPALVSSDGGETLRTAQGMLNLPPLGYDESAGLLYQNQSLPSRRRVLLSGNEGEYVGSVDVDVVLQGCALLLEGSRDITAAIEEEDGGLGEDITGISVQQCDLRACRTAIKKNDVSGLRATVIVDGDKLAIYCPTKSECHVLQISNDPEEGSGRRLLGASDGDGEETVTLRFGSAMVHCSQGQCTGLVGAADGVEPGAQALSVRDEVSPGAMHPQRQRHGRRLQQACYLANCCACTSPRDNSVVNCNQTFPLPGPPFVMNPWPGHDCWTLSDNPAYVSFCCNKKHNVPDSVWRVHGDRVMRVRSVCESYGRHHSYNEIPCPPPPRPPPSPPPPPASSGGFCFPAAARVRLEDGSTRRMDEVRVGDRVLVALQTGGGGALYEDVYMFGHRDRTATTSFVQLKTASGATLRVSPDHYVPVVKGAPDEATLTHTTIPSSDVSVGDWIHVAVSVQKAAETMVWEPIVSKTLVEDVGLFNPYTVGGTIVVNDVAASCHSSWMLDGVFKALGIAVPSGYQAVFAPVRVLYRLVQPQVFNDFVVPIIEAVAAFGNGELPGLSPPWAVTAASFGPVKPFGLLGATGGGASSA